MGSTSPKSTQPEFPECWLLLRRSITQASQFSEMMGVSLPLWLCPETLYPQVASLTCQLHSSPGSRERKWSCLVSLPESTALNSRVILYCPRPGLCQFDSRWFPPPLPRSQKGDWKHNRDGHLARSLHQSTDGVLGSF